jgi:hypothetical protein
MSWYLRKSEGETYGPVGLPVLYQWAADGRIGPDDLLSEDRLHWSAAHERADLEMNWLIELSTGERFGPLHLLAVQALQADGSLPPDCRIRHRVSSEIRSLREIIEASAAGGPRPADPGATPHRPARQEWREIAASKDHFEKEAGKWRQMYEAEHRQGLERDQARDARIEELRRSEVSARTRIESLMHKLGQMERSYALLKEAWESDAANPESAQTLAVIESYQQLAERFESLTQQIVDKSAEVREALASRAQTEQQAAEQVRHMDEIVQRERAEAEHTRKQMARIEEDHLQLLRAYRELNARFIALREQLAAYGPARPQPVPPAENGEEREAGRTRRLKLTRDR